MVSQNTVSIYFFLAIFSTSRAPTVIINYNFNVLNFIPSCNIVQDIAQIVQLGPNQSQKNKTLGLDQSRTLKSRGETTQPPPSPKTFKEVPGQPEV